MFDDLLLHERTRLQSAAFVKRPSHALIVNGAMGAGKQTLARSIAAELLGVTADKLSYYPYFTELDPDEPTITIDNIRSLQKLLNLKTPENRGEEIRRIIIIVNAQRMPNEAQNAFLKSLEEPPVDTCIILTAPGNNDLLPTIYSRAQRIDILPVGPAEASEYFQVAAAKMEKDYILSQGQVGLLAALLGDGEHDLKLWIAKAKSLLTSTPALRMMQTESLSKDKANILLLLNALQRIAHAGLVASATANKITPAKHWHEVLTSVQFTATAYYRNANTKLLLDDLFLNL